MTLADSSTRARGLRLPTGILAAIFVVLLALMLVWAGGTNPSTLREQLKVLQFWSLEICVALVALSVWRFARTEPGPVDRRGAASLALVTVAAFALAAFVAPRTSRIYYDEQIYQSVGQNLADLRLAQMCNDGNVEYGRLQCFSGEYNKQPYAYPHLLSVGYRLFGVRPGTAFVLNHFVMVLSVAAVYLLALWLFADAFAAFGAALLLTLMPQQVLWSATAAVEPSSALACTIAVIAAVWFRRTRRTAALAAVAATTVYAVQFRAESLLVVPVVGVLLWECRDELWKPRSWWIALLGLALLTAHVGHLFAVRNEGWGTTDSRLSLQYLAVNLPVNGRFYLGDIRFPVSVTLLAALGFGGTAFRRERLALALWFALFFGVFLLFYAGSYNYGADVRYSLMTYPPLAILGGAGLSQVARWTGRWTLGVDARRLTTAAVILQFLIYLPIVRATTEEAWAARADVRFAQSIAPQLRGNKYVLTQNPGMFHVWGVNAGQMSRMAGDPGYAVALSARYSQGVYLHWNFWCNVQDAVQQQFCQTTLAMHPAEAVAEYGERGQRFVLYRLSPQWPTNSKDGALGGRALDFGRQPR